MASLVERYNRVAMNKAFPLEKIEMDKKYPFLVSDGDIVERGW